MPGQWAYGEFAGASVPDPRYVRVAGMLVERLSQKPEASYSQACGHDGRQAGRRLLRHAGTTPSGLLRGHFQQTAARCTGRGMVLAVQDTTVFDFSSHRATVGLGPIGSTAYGRGLFGHGVLALSRDGEPLGLLHVGLWSRDAASTGIKHLRRERKTQDKESRKWLDGLAAVQESLPAGQQVLLIQDREADVFAFLAAPRRATVHLLVRACHPRRVLLEDSEESCDLLTAASSAPERGRMRVRVPRAANRKEREATLVLRSWTLCVERPRNGIREGVARTRPLSVIEAREENPPEGETGIHWVLLSTMSAATEAECAELVRCYSMRWSIERLHYVLKSGLRAERLQIDDASALMNALALYYVAAWRLLQLTYVARTEPDRPANALLEADEIEALSAASGKPVTTVGEAVHAIALLGGHEHYRNAPAPGPKRLWLGLQRLEGIVFGWRLARAKQL